MSSFYNKSSKQQPALREFNVGEPDDNLPQERPSFVHDAPRQLTPAEREELARRRDVEQGKEYRIDSHARQRLEILSNIGRLTKSVEIDGINFELRTLKSREHREAAMVILNSKNDIDAAYESRRQHLARAIYMIDGQDIDLALGGKDFNLKLDLIDQMEDTVVGKLNDAFNALKDEVNQKYRMETEEQVKEVLEDIKKS